MFCHDFIVEFESQNPGRRWSSVERRVLGALRAAFAAAAAADPPRGVAGSPQSRAMFAADVMLAWEEGEGEDVDVQPKLLEVNWGPDCRRACDYYPEFFDDVFSVLFLGETEGRNVTRL